MFKCPLSDHGETVTPSAIDIIRFIYRVLKS